MEDSSGFLTTNIKSLDTVFLENRNDRMDYMFLRGETNLQEDFYSYRDRKENLIFMKIGIADWNELQEQYAGEICEKTYQRFCENINMLYQNQVRLYTTQRGEVFLLGDSNLDAKMLFTRIEKEDTKQQYLEETMLYYSLYAGYVEIAVERETYQSARKKLEFACKCAWLDGNGQITVFQEERYEKYLRKLSMKEQLKYDVAHDFQGFEVYYQPIVSGDTKEVSGAEALLRWKSQKYGMVSPAEFIPVLEQTGLIVPVGKWVLYTAICQCKEWQRYRKEFRMNINLSHIQLKQSDVSRDLIKDLKECKLDSKYIMLELTESGRVEKDSAVRHMIKHLQKMKVKLAIDDFGTGYSNFCYLKDLKVHIIKIDRTFVANSLASEYQYKLLRHIIEMAHGVQLQVCLEGIESEKELEKVSPLKPDYIQGYLFGHPVDAAAFLEKNLLRYIEEVEVK